MKYSFMIIIDKKIILFEIALSLSRKKEIRCVKKLVTTEYASIAGRKERKIKENVF